MYELTLLEDMPEGIESYRSYCKMTKFDEIKACPICNISIAPTFIGDIDVGNYRYLLLLCPQCEKLFISEYEYYEQIDEFQHTTLFPRQSISKEFEEPISNISPLFSKVYNQAVEAESYGLDEIAGMGYRKSLEYLIKDYIIYRNPERTEEVKNKLLGSCINELVGNPKIKAMAKGATWIGNDETHYIRKWMDKDINDLKKLIDLTVYWIMFEVKTEEYEAVMKL